MVRNCALIAVLEAKNGQSTEKMFKKRKKEVPGNYRHVCLISVPSKITEQILLGTMLRHMENEVTGGS